MISDFECRTIAAAVLESKSNKKATAETFARKPGWLVQKDFNRRFIELAVPIRGI
jgi:hypothetical protein